MGKPSGKSWSTRPKTSAWSFVDMNVKLLRSIEKNATGKDIPQMMFNAQTADGFWHGNGGDGWLRIMEFMPDGQTIKIKTFSPLFAISPTTADKSWRTESYDQFDITIK